MPHKKLYWVWFECVLGVDIDICSALQKQKGLLLQLHSGLINKKLQNMSPLLAHCV